MPGLRALRSGVGLLLLLLLLLLRGAHVRGCSCLDCAALHLIVPAVLRCAAQAEAGASINLHTVKYITQESLEAQVMRTPRGRLQELHARQCMHAAHTSGMPAAHAHCLASVRMALLARKCDCTCE